MPISIMAVVELPNPARNEAMSSDVSPGELLLRSIVFTRPVRLVDPPSWVPHIPFAFWLIDALRPRTVVELGTHTGVSYSAFAQAVQILGLDTATYAVDTWKGDHQANFYGEEVFKEWSSFHDHHFSAFSRLVRSTFEEALSKFPDGSVDLLHIDGLHTYEAIRQDFESWFPKLSNRAIVLMHDTNVREADFGVWRFWPEVTAQYPSFAFLHGHGLGVVGVGNSLPDDVRWLVQDVGNHGHIAPMVREFFATLGEGLLRQLNESIRAPERAQMVARLAEQDALVTRLTAEATQAAAHAHERAELVERLAERDALVTRLTTESTQIAAQQAESEAAFWEVHTLAADLVNQLSVGSTALDRAYLDARVQGEQMSTVATELASLRENLRTSSEQAEAARNRTQTLERELAVLREQMLTAQRKADAERDRTEGLQNEVAGLQRRLNRASTRRATLNRKVANLRVAVSRLARQLAARTAQQRKQARTLKHVHRSRSWRWTAPFRRTLDVARSLRLRSFGTRDLRGWARTARTLISPSHLRDVRAIARCGLFDEAFYLRTYPDVGRASISPLVHYAVTGAAEGRWPHPLFDGKY
ncbi:MAG TPA: class I SAM-dependent methyltransferase, partial [Gemmatimonadaceae bacterium]|nr:class I SAM-dependent methyltransferase [Gemmatimonadaceae bacterium]